jgi:hypothetical protein
MAAAEVGRPAAIQRGRERPTGEIPGVGGRRIAFRFGHAETVLEKGYKKERGFARGGLAKEYSIQQRCIYEVAHRRHEDRIIG